MQPLQVWLPALKSLLLTAQDRRDRQRALDAWDGEVTVWLLPDLDKTTRWYEGPGRRAVAIPAERLERIDIYHVGANGYVLGRTSASLFPRRRIDGLLDAWLSYEQLGRIEMYNPPKLTTFEVPRICASGVQYQEIELEVRPSGILPIRKVEESTRTVHMSWPPESEHWGTVSPDAESEERFGPFERADEDGIPMGVSCDGRQRTLFQFLRWPAPLAPLIPDADGIDMMFGQRQMAAIARQSEADLVGALMRAREGAQSGHVFDGHTSREWAWFWVTLLAAGDDAVLFQAQDLGFKAESLSALSTNADFRKAMAQQIQIRRAWGPLGLFWALLLQHFESQQSFHLCQDCQRLITGNRNKTFCGPGDNKACFKARRTRDQRSSRDRRRKTTSGK